MSGLVLLILAVWLTALVVLAVVRWRPDAPARTAPRRAPIRRPVRADVPHALYDYHYAGRAEVIYSGISNEPPVRHRRHENEPKDQWWYLKSTKKMHVVGWYPNRVTAQAAERERVRTLALAGHRLANNHHNPVRRTRRAA